MALSDNLVAYWSLEDATDAVGSLDLTNNNSVTFDTGIVGDGAVFASASSQSLSHASDTTLVMGDVDFSISMWVYLETRTDYQTFIAKDNGGSTYEYSVRYDRFGSNRFQFLISNDGTAEQTWVAASTFGIPPEATWCFLVCRHDATANEISICVNDGTVETTSHSGGAYAGSATFYVGDAGGYFYLNGMLDEIGIWKRVLSDAEVTELYNSGSGRDYAYISGSGATYTLTTDAGSYTVTGQAATLLANRQLTTDAGSYTVTGQAATLLANRALALNAGSYAVTGQNPSLLASRKLTADAGSYAVTGQATSLLVNRLLSAEAGSYTLTGLEATLTYTPGATYTLTADAGSYTLTGQAASLLVNRVLTADTGSYVVVGAAASLLINRLLAAGAGSYTVTGQNPSLLLNRLLATDAGSYALTGKAVGFVYSGAAPVTTPDTRIYIVPGSDRTYVILSDDRTYTVSSDDRTYAAQ